MPLRADLAADLPEQLLHEHSLHVLCDFPRAHPTYIRVLLHLYPTGLIVRLFPQDPVLNAIAPVTDRCAVVSVPSMYTTLLATNCRYGTEC